MKRAHPFPTGGENDPIDVDEEIIEIPEDVSEYESPPATQVYIPDIVNTLPMTKSLERIFITNQEETEENEEEDPEATLLNEEMQQILEKNNPIRSQITLVSENDTMSDIALAVNRDSLNIENLDKMDLSLDVKRYERIFENVVKLTLPETLTRLDSTFREAMPRLEEVVSGRMLLEIGEGAMLGMTRLTRFNTWNSASIKSIETNAFIGCSKLDDLYIPNSITQIGSSAFEGCGLRGVILDPLDCELKSNAFAKCTRLRRLQIAGGGIVKLGYGVFQQCISLKSVLMDNCVCYKFPAKTFSGCSQLTELRLPVSLTSVGSYFIEDCDIGNLTFVDLKDIGVDAFRNATIRDLDLGESLEEIGENAFKDCIVTNGLEIPTSILSLHSKAIESPSLRRFNLTEYSKLVFIDNDSLYCTNLVSLELPEEPFSRHYYTHTLTSMNINRDVTLKLPDTLTCINQNPIIYYTDNSKAVTYYASYGTVKTLALNGFKTEVMEIVATRIDPYAFVGDTYIREISIDRKVDEISNMAFVSLTNLERVHIPEKFRSRIRSIFANTTANFNFI